MMTRRSLLLSALAAPAFAADSLFNGRDLSGWRHAGFGLWTVEDGAIVARYDKARIGPGYLFTERAFQDFHLSLEFWTSPEGNSGVYVREPLRKWGTKGDERPAHGAGAGYEIQIDYGSQVNPTGAVYDVQRPARVVGGNQRWNRFEIDCAGSRIRISVDGQLVNDFTSARIQPGHIGLQMHGATPHDHVVKFRNLTIRQ
jgi:hypothetical protein